MIITSYIKELIGNKNFWFFFFSAQAGMLYKLSGLPAIIAIPSGAVFVFGLLLYERAVRKEVFDIMLNREKNVQVSDTTGSE